MRLALLAPWLLAVAALSHPAAADQKDSRLGALFDRLSEADTPLSARPAEAEIWRIWLEANDEEIDALMRKGIEEMSTRRLDAAISTFGQVVELRPEFAEGWNKRATAYYLNDELEESVRDIQRTLALEPRHFGAISGMGLIFIRQGDFPGALDAFREVLKLHPHAQGARSNIEMLETMLRDKVI